MKLHFLMLALAIVAAPASFADKEPSVSHLPPAVQQSIRDYKGEGDLKKVKTKRDASGATVYEVEYKEGGDEKQIIVGADGAVISESAGKKEKEKNKGKARGHEKKDKKDKERGDDDDDEKSGGLNDADSPVRQPAPGPAIGRPRPPSTNSAATTPVPGARPDGVVVIPTRDAPNPVEKAAERDVRRMGKIETVRAETRNGKTLYHVQFERGSISYTPEAKTVDRDQYWQTVK